MTVVGSKFFFQKMLLFGGFPFDMRRPISLVVDFAKARMRELDERTKISDYLENFLKNKIRVSLLWMACLAILLTKGDKL